MWCWPAGSGNTGHGRKPDALREHAGLPGTKKGCDHGQFGTQPSAGASDKPNVVVGHEIYLCVLIGCYPRIAQVLKDVVAAALRVQRPPTESAMAMCVLLANRQLLDAT